MATIDYLTYASYRYNRRRSPHITADQWRVVFGDAVNGMEARFQAETAAILAQENPLRYNPLLDELMKGE
jgi:hypothetical protein